MTQDWQSITNALLVKNESTRSAVGLNTETDMSPLQIASWYDANLAHQMLESGVECDLHSASALGLSHQVKRLASAGGLDIEADFLPPIGWAIVKSKPSSVEQLLQCGDSANRPLRRIGFFQWEVALVAEASWRPIHAAVAHGYSETASEVIDLLVEQGASVSDVCMLGEAPIHLAACYDWVNVFHCLIKHGVDVNSPTRPCSPNVLRLSSPEGTLPEHQITPMMVAAREGSEEVSRLLVQHQADVNRLSSRGRQALHIASDAWWRENLEIITLLLNAGANPHHQDSQGMKPADYAKSRGYTAIEATLAALDK